MIVVRDTLTYSSYESYMSDETDPYRTQSRNGKRARRGPSSANIITELSTANSLIVNMQRAVLFNTASDPDEKVHD